MGYLKVAKFPLPDPIIELGLKVGFFEWKLDSVFWSPPVGIQWSGGVFATRNTCRAHTLSHLYPQLLTSGLTTEGAQKMFVGQVIE